MHSKLFTTVQILFLVNKKNWVKFHEWKQQDALSCCLSVSNLPVFQFDILMTKHAFLYSAWMVVKLHTIIIVIFPNFFMVTSHVQLMTPLTQHVLTHTANNSEINLPAVAHTYNHGQKSWNTFAFLGIFQFTHAQPLPSPHKQCWTRVSRIFSKFQLCIGWGRDNCKKILKRMHCSMREPRMTGKYEYCVNCSYVW